MGGSTRREACSRWRVRNKENEQDRESNWVDVYGKSKHLAL